MIFILPCSGAAWCGHTDESREWAEDIQGAFDDIGMKHVEAAAAMRLPGREELGKQLAGKLPLNLWRLGYLPKAFHIKLFKRRAHRIGGAFLTADDIALIRGFVGMGSRTPLKMLPDEEQERRHA